MSRDSQEALLFYPFWSIDRPRRAKNDSSANPKNDWWIKNSEIATAFAVHFILQTIKNRLSDRHFVLFVDAAHYDFVQHFVASGPRCRCHFLPNYCFQWLRYLLQIKCRKGKKSLSNVEIQVSALCIFDTQFFDRSLSFILVDEVYCRYCSSIFLLGSFFGYLPSLY